MVKGREQALSLSPSSRPHFSTIVGLYLLGPSWQAPLCSLGHILETQLKLLEQKGNLVTFGPKLRTGPRARASNTIRISLLHFSVPALFCELAPFSLASISPEAVTGPA